MKTWMRKRGDRVRITTGKYAGQTGTVESNVFQKTVDYPGELSNGFQVMPDTGVVIVRWDQVGELQQIHRSGWYNFSNYNVGRWCLFAVDEVAVTVDGPQ